ncbi:hypothetical protein [Streptomyces sp. NBC_01353]|uniref:hypothetical protein n=1 Tax=Streptomyces sp. NBC_01353 TaxID=2903835 RepID=UPI002E2F2029|nr:hypothetical protein [Streptomyces sp. NBC_01353]
MSDVEAELLPVPPAELPAQRPVTRRVDETAADMGTLIDMGVVEEQPEPPPAEPPPEEPAPEPVPEE